MLLSWIVKTIPRSVRSFLALLVMLGSLALLFSGLQELFDPAGGSKSLLISKLTVGLVIGLPATAVFYYFQSQDEAGRHQKHELEVLNDYMESDRRQRIYKQSQATPVFDSRGGPLPNAGDTAAPSDRSESHHDQDSA